MSLGRPNNNEYISPEDYVDNQHKIQLAKKLLEDMERKNQLGYIKFTEREKQMQAAQAEIQRQKEELQKKIQEGLEAERLVKELEARQANISQLTYVPASEGARIEEIHDNRQSNSSLQPFNIFQPYNSVAPNPNQLPPQSQNYYGTFRTQPQTRPLAITAPLSRPTNTQSYALNSVSSVFTGTNTEYSTQSFQPLHEQQMAAINPNQAPTVSWISSRPFGQFPANMSSGGVPFRPTETGNASDSHPATRQQTYNYYTPYQNAAAGSSSNFNRVPPQQPTASHPGGLSRANAGPHAPGFSTPLPPAQQVNSRYVDEFGVPYIALSEQQISDVRRRLENWDRQAPPGTMDRIHDMLMVYKDKALEPETWIYVPVSPGNENYARTNQIDKFFDILAKNALLARNGTIRHVSITTSSANPENTNESNGTHTKAGESSAKGTVQPSSKPKSNFVDTSLPFGRTAIPNTCVPPSLSQDRPGLQTAQASITPSNSVIPSNSVMPSNLPKPSQVDKTSLSKNIMFALGKRPRVTQGTATEEPIAKKPALDATVTSSNGIVPISKTSGLPLTASNTTADPSNAQSTSNPALPPQTIKAVPRIESQQSIAPSGVVEPNLLVQQPGVIGHVRPTNTSHSNVSTAPAERSVATAPQEKPNAAVNMSSSGQDKKLSSTTVESIAQVVPKPQMAPSLNPYAHLLTKRLDLQTLASGSSLNHQQGESSRSANYQYFTARPPQPPQHKPAQAPQKKNLSPKHKEPLFLPSSSPERGPSASSSTVIKSEERSIRLTKNGKKTKKIVYVQVPEPPDYLIRYRRRLANGAGIQSDTEMTRQKFQGLRTRTSSVSVSLTGEEVSESDAMVEPRSEITTADKAEQEALHLACSRLQPVVCRWNGCNVSLNSVNALLRHVELHKPSPSANNRHFTCLWAHCGKRCGFTDKHLEKHPLLLLKCAFQGCDEFFRSGSRLLAHYRAKHAADELKPSAELQKANLGALPPVPGIIPSYSFVTKTVKPATISPERHELLCRWVVQTIVNSDQERPTRMRTKKTAKNVKLPMGAPRDDYEFITTRSTRYSSYLSQPVDRPFEDLDSASISKMLDSGLTLWNANDGDDSAPMDEPPPPVSPTQPTSNDIDVAHAGLATVHTDHPVQDQSNDEEAVESMLTQEP